jgi:acyl carrier protein
MDERQPAAYTPVGRSAGARSVINEELLLGFLGDELNVDTSSIVADEPLFSTGVIDSFALITLMTYLETQCGFRIAPMEVTLDNFDSIERILRFAERKLQDLGA